MLLPTVFLLFKNQVVAELLVSFKVLTYKERFSVDDSGVVHPTKEASELIRNLAEALGVKFQGEDPTVDEVNKFMDMAEQFLWNQELAIL